MCQLKTGLILGALFCVLLVLGVFSLKIGSVELSFHEIFRFLIEPNAVGYKLNQLIFFESRLPRTLTAVLVGAVLAASGVIFYYIADNDLACPSLLGVNYGIYFGIICGVSLMGISSTLGVFACGAGGGLITGSLVYLIALRGGFSPLKLILVGQVFNLFTYAACQLLFILAPAKTENLMINLNGSLATTSLAQLSIYAWLLIAAIILTICLISKNYLFSLGAEVAKSLGLNTGFLLFVLLTLILLISTVSVVLVGPLLFFPLLAVQISRLLISRHRPLVFLLVNLLIGAALLLASDVMLRLIYQDWEAPLNIFIAVLGVPVLIYHSKSLR